MDKLPQRKHIRMKDYDYSQVGCYFITICTHDRQNLLSYIVGSGSSRPNMMDEELSYAQMQLASWGEIVKQHLADIVLKYPSIRIDKYVIMPNHIHLILVLYTENGRDNPAPTVTIGNILGYFKYQTTKSINALQNNGILKVWQRGYYDHIIRNEADYQKIWEYIDTNPLKWELDKYYRE
ncbi:transposase [Anaerosolibacter sp.]|uniref:transposase n=1 Tax=Anaerosolibacter sp. TaxID=1872527 RepID=UPI0039EEE469